jgi:hypothetical protein
MRILHTSPTDNSIDWDKLTPEERDSVRRDAKALSDPEICDGELGTGALLVRARSVLEKYGEFLAFLKTLHYTERTLYRRIKAYERACELWPSEVVDAAIKRKLRIIGATNEKPMGAFEDIPAPKNLTPQKIEEFLNEAEIQARRSASGPSGDENAYESLKACFRTVEQMTRSLNPKEQTKFLEDFVGMMMTLIGIKESWRFEKTQIPSDFWGGRGGHPRSKDVRERISKAASERWKRVREAKSKRK